MPQRFYGRMQEPFNVFFSPILMLRHALFGILNQRLRCFRGPAMRRIAVVLLFLTPLVVHANAPVASYIFPAGGQRGTKVNVRVGGLFLHEQCGFEMLGAGVAGPDQLKRTKTTWFEGPLLPLPDSQRQEDYPKDMA